MKIYYNNSYNNLKHLLIILNYLNNNFTENIIKRKFIIKFFFNKKYNMLKFKEVTYDIHFHYESRVHYYKSCR